MSELDRLSNSMQRNFEVIFEKLDTLQENSISNTKDIEYIKEDLKAIKEQKKENRKMIAVAITSGVALVGTLLNILFG